MSNNTTAILTFNAADGVEIGFKGARPSKASVVEVGFQYYTLASEGTTGAMDQIIDQYGPVLVRRALLAFSNVTAKMGHKDVSAAARVLRSEIKVLPAAKAV